MTPFAWGFLAGFAVCLLFVWVYAAGRHARRREEQKDRPLTDAEIRLARDSFDDYLNGRPSRPEGSG